jgi:hypothetical protein
MQSLYAQAAVEESRHALYCVLVDGKYCVMLNASPPALLIRTQPGSAAEQQQQLQQQQQQQQQQPHTQAVVPFSAAAVWHRQRQYYNERGMCAWSEQEVPCGISSGALAAEVCAQVRSCSRLVQQLRNQFSVICDTDILP